MEKGKIILPRRKFPEERRSWAKKEDFEKFAFFKKKRFRLYTFYGRLPHMVNIFHDNEIMENEI
jgi:hypothetical protein